MLAPPLIFAALAGIFLFGLNREDPNALPSARQGSVVPPLTLSELGKPVFTTEDLMAPGVKLVNFWASWCAPCRVEHPQLLTLAGEGVPIYGINYKDTNANGLAFLEELTNPFAGQGADPEARTALDWGVAGIPETFIIDGDGVIVMRFAGPITKRILDIRIRPAIESAKE